MVPEPHVSSLRRPHSGRTQASGLPAKVRAPQRPHLLLPAPPPAPSTAFLGLGAPPRGGRGLHCCLGWGHGDLGRGWARPPGPGRWLGAAPLPTDGSWRPGRGAAEGASDGAAPGKRGGPWALRIWRGCVPATPCGWQGREVTRRAAIAGAGGCPDAASAGGRGGNRGAHSCLFAAPGLRRGGRG